MGDKIRIVRYQMGPAFLNLGMIGTNLTFKVGNMEVPNFRMIERHYFRDILI